MKSTLRRTVAALVVGSALAASAASAQTTGGSPKPEPPVSIQANEVEYADRKNYALFTGKVVADQGDTTLTAERMEVRFAPSENEGKRTSAGGGRITSIIATDSVTFRQVDPETGHERYATGDRGEYDAEAGTLTMTGKPRLWENKNVVTGETIIYFIDTHVFTVKGKVNLTIYPEEQSGEDKKP